MVKKRFVLYLVDKNNSWYLYLLELYLLYGFLEVFEVTLGSHFRNAWMGQKVNPYHLYNTPYILIQNFLMWTHGQKLMGGEQSLHISKILKNPAIVSIFIGMALLLSGITLPPFLKNAIGSVGNCIAPLNMVVTGVVMSEFRMKEVFSNKRAYFISTLRLIVFPLLVVPILLLVKLLWPLENSVNILVVNLLCAVGPAASTITQMATLYHNPHAGYVSIINVLSTLLCVVTMPLICSIFMMLV